jgi:menaquinone-dependent protoporphyrinogen oxidase
MSAPRILIAYATTHGQTASIATCIQLKLEQLGCHVTTANLKEGPAPPLGEFNGVIVGASIIARGHQPAAAAFIRENLNALNTMPAAFFSVSASAGSSREQGRAAARRLRNAFLAEVGFSPVMAESIAGAIKYTRYNILLRWYMKRASKLNGGSTDTSRDHEYTDWNQVGDFARGFAEMVTPAVTDASPPDATRQAIPSVV